MRIGNKMNYKNSDAMKKYHLLVIILLSGLFTSCLKDGLDEGELSVECDVTNVKFEHRWAIDMNTPGMAELRFKEMQVQKNIDKESCTIDVTITVPKADGNYPEEERNATTLSKLACSFEISRAASVRPLNTAPVLGTLGDYNQETRYRVTSASGEYKDWVLRVIEFKK